MAPEEEVIQVEKKPKKSKKGLIIGVIVLFFLLLLLLGAAWFALRTGLLGDFMAGLDARNTAPSGGSVQTEKSPDYMHEMPEILVNLDDGGARSRFLSIKFFIGYDNARLESELEQRTPEIRDKVLKVLWDVSGEDVLTAAGKERLRDDLHQTIDDMFLNDYINGIYFWHVMVQ